MTSLNKLNVISFYTWSIGSNGFEGVFIIVPNEKNIIELTNSIKRRQKYEEFVFITKEGKLSKARDLFIIEEYGNYTKPNTNHNEYINYKRFRFRCKKLS
jgi:hypothetical protein